MTRIKKLARDHAWKHIDDKYMGSFIEGAEWGYSQALEDAETMAIALAHNYMGAGFGKTIEQQLQEGFRALAEKEEKQA